MEIFYKNIIGYKIKTDDATTEFSFPVEQFSEHRQGMVFTPNWYRNALETVEKLEFFEKISPELTTLVQDGRFNEELYDLLIKRDDEFSDDLDDAILLKEVLVAQIKILEERRIDLSEKANNLVSKRLIEDVDRKQFSEQVSELRQKVKLLDINIQKSSELLQRLHHTSVGAVIEYVTEFVTEQPDHSRKPSEQVKRQPHEHLKEKDSSLTEVFAELIEEKIIDDIITQLKQHKIPQRFNHSEYAEKRRGHPNIQKDDEWTQRRSDVLRKRRQRFR